MKKSVLVLIALISSLLLAVPAFAQGGEDITVLNDATPGIDVVILTQPGTSGAVSLELFQAKFRVADSTGRIVFESADPRIHGFEFRLAPDAGVHTLTVERMPGVAEAYIRITPEADLPDPGLLQLVSVGKPVGLNQESDLPLNISSPSQTVSTSIPADTLGTVTMTFPGAPVTAQVVDDIGQAVATLYGGTIDGVSLLLESGRYDLTLLNASQGTETVANVRVMPAPGDAVMESVVANTADPASDTLLVAAGPACSVTINASSINMRSGPGTGYSVLDYGFRNEELVVGGTNTTRSWLLVGTNDGSAWISGNLGILQGNCDNLAVYDIPYRAARQPQVVVQQVEPVFVQAAPVQTASNTFSGGYEEHEEHEEHDEHDEHDDD